MEAEYKTVEEIRKIIGVSNTMLNLYNKTVNAGLVHPIYLVDANVWDLRDYHLTKPAFEKVLLGMKESIIAFRDECYASKTAAIIAKTSTLSLPVVISYLQNRLDTFKSTDAEILEDGSTLYVDSYPQIKNLGDDNIVLPTTEFRNISSFKILADIQKEYLMERISFIH